MRNYWPCITLVFVIVNTTRTSAAITSSSRSYKLSFVYIYPNGTREKDSEGDLPLHWACRFNLDSISIRHLIDVYPDGARVKGRDEKNPLHWAFLRGGGNSQTIQALMDVYPEGIMEETDYELFKNRSYGASKYRSKYLRHVLLEESYWDYHGGADDSNDSSSSSSKGAQTLKDCMTHMQFEMFAKATSQNMD
mmetsp:Transcript_39155/g.94669  ORF Transcript_39155/g.94669 Transcript_39155/m.94669 type:complete len:193 (+) Transcript_39155:648-1226(+)